MINLPSTDKAWSQPNNSDLFGNIYITKNISFDNEGYLTLSHSPRAIIDESTTNWDNTALIIYNADSQSYVFQTWDEPFTQSAVSNGFLATLPTEDVSANNPSGSSKADGGWFDGKLIVTEASDVKYYDSSTNAWVDTNISLTNTSNTSQHPVELMLNRAAVAIANVNTVLLYTAFSATPTLGVTLTLPVDFEVSSMAYYNDNLYIGTRHKYGGDASLFVWNGQGTGNNGAFPVNAVFIFDVVVFQDSIYILTSSGALLRFNGSGFTQDAAFPVFYSDRVLTDDSNVSIYHNCMKANSDVLYISFSDDENASRYMTNQPSGVWCYDPKVGLYHKFSFSNSVTYKLSDPAINTGTDQITVATTLATGTEVWYQAATANTSLATDTKYFVIYVSATAIKLATTKANALAGTAINFSADDGVGEVWTFFPNIDFGQIRCGRPMAVQTIDYSQDNPEYGADVFWSGEAENRDRSQTTYAYLGTVSDGVEARGYFITPKIHSSEITDRFNNIVLKWMPLQSELDKIIIKYRTVDDNKDIVNLEPNTPYIITWTSTTTFTSTGTHWGNAVAGDEINVLSGAAGGLLAHLTTAPTFNAGTYTMTIDESFADYLSGDKSIAVFRNWKKWRTITNIDTDGFISQELGVVGKFLQLKTELRGIGVKIEELKVDNKYHLRASRSNNN